MPTSKNKKATLEIGGSRRRVEHIFRGSSFVASSQGSSLLPFHLRLSIPEEMPPSHRLGKPVGRAVCANFPESDIMSFGLCLFIHLTHHFTQAVRIPRCPLKPAVPPRPGPRRKEPIIAPHATECPMITGSPSCVCVCAPWARAQLACLCPPTAGGRWRRKACLRVVVTEKSHFK